MCSVLVVTGEQRKCLLCCWAERGSLEVPQDTQELEAASLELPFQCIVVIWIAPPTRTHQVTSALG